MAPKDDEDNKICRHVGDDIAKAIEQSQQLTQVQHLPQRAADLATALNNLLTATQTYMKTNRFQPFDDDSLPDSE